MKTRVYAFLIFLVIFVFFLLSSCMNNKIKVALLTNLSRANEIGESEILMSKLYLKTNPKSKIQLEYYNDGWDKELVHIAIEKVLKNKIKFIITTHTSTVANEIIDIVNNNDMLSFVLGATTINLSNKNDNNFRLISDVKEEQTQIANYVKKLNVRNITLLIDTKNKGYTFLARDFFKNNFKNEIIKEIYFNAQDFNIDSIIKSIDFIKNNELFYFIVGSGSTQIGAIAQAIYNKNKNIKIFFTPWVMNEEIVKILGNAIESSIFSSFLPSPLQNEKINLIKSKFYEEYDIYPTIISYKVFEALELLDYCFSKKFYTPAKVKKLIISIKNFQLSFEDLIFNENGDFNSKIYFFNDLKSFYE